VDSVNKVLLIGRLIAEPDFEASRGGRLHARARIEVTAKGQPTVVTVIFGGVAAEVLSTDIAVGDILKVSGWVYGHEPKKNGKKSIALILSESAEPVRKGGSR
jgi:hypothetical protein